MPRRDFDKKKLQDKYNGGNATPELIPFSTNLNVLLLRRYL